MITCCECKEEKPDEEFAWKKKDVKRASKCKTCHKEYRRNHYEANKEKYIKRAREWDKNNPSIVERNKRHVVDYLSKNPCVGCGEKDVVTLTFDHRDPSEKSSGVFILMKNGHKLETLQAEMDKCDVRCYNCHAKRTASQFNWYKLRMRE